MKITKKNGNITMYDDQKVINSILKANAGTSEKTMSDKIAASIADDVFSQLTEDYEIITTKDIRDCVYKTLLDRGFTETARAYIEYKG